MPGFPPEKLSVYSAPLQEPVLQNLFYVYPYQQSRLNSLMYPLEVGTSLKIVREIHWPALFGKKHFQNP